DGARCRLWASAPQEAPRRHVGSGARDRGDRLWPEGAPLDRYRDEDSPGRQGLWADKTVFLTKAGVAQPLQPFDVGDRSLIENCCIKETKQQWDLGHPPKKPHGWCGCMSSSLC